MDITKYFLFVLSAFILTKDKYDYFFLYCLFY